MIRILSILVLFLAGCQSGGQKRAQTLEINIVAEPQSLHPHLATDVASVCLSKMLFEGLTRIGPDDKPHLALAEGVEISPDLKTYTFHLRPSLNTRGDKVTAKDFVRSWKQVLSPDFAGQNAQALYVLKNAEKIKKGKLSPEALGVKAENDALLIVRLENPTPYFLEILAHPVCSPLPEHWEERERPFVSNGPFKLTEWKHNHKIELEKNLAYWDADCVQINAISACMVPAETELLLFESGELHLAGSPLSTIPVDSLPSLAKKFPIYKKAIAGTDFLRINVEAIKHPELRRALSRAIDRKAIAEDVMRFQIPAMGYLPHSEKLSGEEGLEASFQEEIPSLTLLYVNSERRHLIAQALQQMWREKLGIQVKLEAMEKKVYFDRLAKGDYEMAQSSWLADYNDPVNFLEIFKGPNNTAWENSGFTELINASYTTGNPEKREEMLVASEAILLDDAPIAPLFHYTMMYMKDPRLEGLVLTSMGQVDFKWAQWNNGKK